MNENYFSTLYAINVSDKTEKKNGLTYLSWAWAWAEIKKIHPYAIYTIYENSNGWFYHTDGKTCWVKTGVTIEGTEHIEYLPVMNYNNRSIPAESVTSFDVNKAIQRSLTKAVARHGLGLYVYAGEDLPDDEKEAKNPRKEKKPQSKSFETTELAINLAKSEQELIDDTKDPDATNDHGNPRGEKKAKKVDSDTILLAVKMAKTKDELLKIWQGLDPDTRVELQEVFSQRKAEL